MKQNTILAAVALLGLSVVLASKARASQSAAADKARADYTTGLIPGFFDLKSHGPEHMLNDEPYPPVSAVPMFSPLP